MRQTYEEKRSTCAVDIRGLHGDAKAACDGESEESSFKKTTDGHGLTIENVVSRRHDLCGRHVSNSFILHHFAPDPELKTRISPSNALSAPVPHAPNGVDGDVSIILAKPYGPLLFVCA